LRREQTEQVKIDTASLLGMLFADSRLAVDPIIGQRLWSVGRQTIASRSRDLKFVRGIGARENDSIIDQLSRCPKAILFTPSRGSADFWRRSVPCATIALEAITRETPTGIGVDWQAVEELLTDDHANSTQPVKPRRKRGTRTAKIEQLRDELKRHLASAADHAIATAESDGGIALLPRPTKTQLAKLAGMSKYDVTRCFDDPTASELRLLWDTADDLEAVLRLRGRSAVAK
jgi:hypothetical protein